MSKLDQLSDEPEITREVIGKPPPGIVLYGSGLILLVIVILLLFSCIIYIPDRINGAITFNNTTYGKMTIPVNRSMHLRTGLPVMARIPGATPANRFSFTGTTTAVSLLPDKKHYLVTVVFPEGILLPVGALPTEALPEGEAQVTTGNKRLIQRIFSHFN